MDPISNEVLTMSVYKAEAKPQDGEVAKKDEGEEGEAEKGEEGGEEDSKEDNEADRDEYADDLVGVYIGTCTLGLQSV